ncbi:hypothetical protein R6Q57_017107 [Mikania cordata]
MASSSTPKIQSSPTTTPNDCCSWSGVACNDKTGHVASLDLSLGNLEGNISPSLLNLSYLNHIDLQGNSFNGPIPMFIGSMTQLRYLDLSSNVFNGSIPMFIGSITQLRYLDLSYNSFSGSIPPQLGNLTNLQGCDLSQVMHSYSSSVDSNSSSIAELHLGNNNLNSSMYHWLFSLTSNRPVCWESLQFDIFDF